MNQTISLNLTRNSVEKFSEVFNSLETLDTKNIDILIIVSIKNKLKIESLVTLLICRCIKKIKHIFFLFIIYNTNRKYFQNNKL